MIRPEQFASQLAATAKSIVKIITLSRRADINRADRNRRLIILGNGPSLRDTIDHDREALDNSDLLAVNFAANTDDYLDLKPEYYLLADPHFFDASGSDPNVKRLWDRIATLTHWPMTLLIPAGIKRHDLPAFSPSVAVKRFNFIGIEGFRWFEDLAYDRRLGMPRPRNVLIPAIMSGIWSGYKEIYLAGSDHSWMRTLSVDETNRVISVQPHFYADDKSEHQRVSQVYADVKLHEIIMSFYVAFSSYHKIARYAASRDVKIYNVTPGSFIDAFPRRDISQ